MNYEELEGKTLVFPELGKTGVVVGCDPDVGITIVNIEDKDNYLVCISGPSSTQWEGIVRAGPEGEDAKRIYHQLFDLLIERIKNGSCTPSKISLAIKGCRSGASPSAENCAFAQ